MARRRKRPPRKRTPSPLLNDSGEHTIPKPLPERLLADFLITRPKHEERYVREYVESQARQEKVTHLEKVKTEHLRTRALDAWDVRTTRDRYWVITNPTNLYSQKLFPSLDFTISFHIGVIERGEGSPLPQGHRGVGVAASELVDPHQGRSPGGWSPGR